MAELKFPAYFYHKPLLIERGVEIGHGYCGRVYKILRGDGHQYAVKWYRSSLRDATESEDELSRLFEQEVDANLIIKKDKNLEGLVPACHGAFFSQDPSDPADPVLVFDFVDGQGLWCIEPTEPISFIARIKHELSSIVESLHRAGVAHGDIRPENIIIRPALTSQASPPPLFPSAQNSTGKREDEERNRRDEKEKDALGMETREEQYLCVLLDFSNASTYEHPHFESTKNLDWRMLSTTIGVTRERLYTRKALDCLKEASSEDTSAASKAREELALLLKDVDICNDHLYEMLNDFELNDNESLLYAVAEYRFRQRELSLGLSIYDRIKTNNPTHDKIKWALLCAKGHKRRRQYKEACEVVEKALKDAIVSNKLFHAEDYIRLVHDLSSYLKPHDFSKALYVKSRLLLDLWKFEWPSTIGGVDITVRQIQSINTTVAITSYPPSIFSFSTSVGRVSIDTSRVPFDLWREWIKECTLDLKKWFYNTPRSQGQTAPVGLISTCKKVTNASLTALNADNYRPPTETVEALSTVLSSKYGNGGTNELASNVARCSAILSGSLTPTSLRRSTKKQTDQIAATSAATPLAELDVNITSPKRTERPGNRDCHGKENETLSPSKKQKQ